jgi:hypothetical protein
VTRALAAVGLAALLASVVTVACNGSPAEPVSRERAVPNAATLPSASAPVTRHAEAALAPPRPAPGSDVCTALCAKTAALKCRGASGCAAGCRQMIEGSRCGGETSRFFGCLIGEPLSHFECDETGTAAISEAYCDAEQRAVTQCFAAVGNGTTR